MRRLISVLGVAGLVLCLSQCGDDGGEVQQEAIRDLVRDEEAVLEVTTLSQRLARSLESGALVSGATRELFATGASVVDLVGPDTEKGALKLGNGVTKNVWEVGDAHELNPDGSIWQGIVDAVAVSGASFGFVSGESDSQGVLKTLLKFGAKGECSNGEVYGFKGKVEVDWVRQGASWQVVRWHTRSMTVSTREKHMFSNRMHELMSASDRELAERSFHEEKLTEFIQTGETLLPKGKYGPYFQPESGYQHPAVSVVDINQDGWDDLFVTSLWAPCQLWVNQQGRGFVEEARKYGLDVHACCTSAIFADFDNDGDCDLVLGRSLERSRIYWNEGGRYVQAMDELPYLVTSISAADCNNDGLLDIYLCTYGPSGTSSKQNPQWMAEFLPSEVASNLKNVLESSHRYYDQAGPKNYLLINRGRQKFEAAPPNEVLDQYHNTYQASWGDYDKDGDVDVYICNDFAPDSLLRNDGWGDDGVPKFADVSVDISSDTMKGFGMGASWGDYNNDQQPDLFVTNMYSKAGHRVLSRFDNIDDRLHFSARGNLLFEQVGGRFEQLAGESRSFGVDQGGWAFGGQFVDFDNDGWQDLYVPNGFYSAPKEVASEADL